MIPKAGFQCWHPRLLSRRGEIKAAPVSIPLRGDFTVESASVPILKIRISTSERQGYPAGFCGQSSERQGRKKINPAAVSGR